jgi:hypothetical protein
MSGTGIMLALMDATSCAMHRSAFSCDLTIVWRIHADKQDKSFKRFSHNDHEPDSVSIFYLWQKLSASSSFSRAFSADTYCPTVRSLR